MGEDLPHQNIMIIVRSKLHLKRIGDSGVEKKDDSCFDIRLDGILGQTAKWIGQQQHSSAHQKGKLHESVSQYKLNEPFDHAFLFKDTRKCNENNHNDICLKQQQSTKYIIGSFF